MTAAAQAFWDDYCQNSGFKKPLPDLDMFGDTAALADELLQLVLKGTKRATCELVRHYEAHGTVPKPGDHCIITNGAGEPCCIIQTTQIDIIPVRDVDAKFAYDEGEGDRSLAYWKREHDAYFTRMAKAAGLTYDDSMLAAAERFKVVWPLDFADP